MAPIRHSLIINPYWTTPTRTATHTPLQLMNGQPRGLHTHTHQMMGIALLGHEHTELLGYRLILC